MIPKCASKSWGSESEISHEKGLWFDRYMGTNCNRDILDIHKIPKTRVDGVCAYLSGCSTVGRSSLMFSVLRRNNIIGGNYYCHSCYNYEFPAIYSDYVGIPYNIPFSLLSKNGVSLSVRKNLSKFKFYDSAVAMVCLDKMAADLCSLCGDEEVYLFSVICLSTRPPSDARDGYGWHNLYKKPEYFVYDDCHVEVFPVFTRHQRPIVGPSINPKTFLQALFLRLYASCELDQLPLVKNSVGAVGIKKVRRKKINKRLDSFQPPVRDPEKSNSLDM